MKRLRVDSKWMKRLLVVAVVIVAAFACGQAVYADVGNNVNHSSGGSSAGNSSSYSGSFDFYTIYMLMRLVMNQPILLVGIIVIVVIYMLGKRRAGEGYSGTPYVAGRDCGETMRASSLKDHASIARLIENDSQFSEQMMVSKVNNMFMRLQLAWMNKRWEEARPFETDALFNTHNMQLEQYRLAGRTNRIEDINISDTKVVSYEVQGNFEYLDVEIRARFLDYIVEDADGKVIKGSTRNPVHMHYRWKLMRKKGVHTNEAHTEATECPNCGANISISQSGKCEYCDSIVTQGDYDWVLSEIECLGQY